jgi:hypothetical protein
MIEIDVDLPASVPGDTVDMAVEQLCANAGLTQTLKGTLAAYPGCTHWHYKRGRERGVLEITWQPRIARLWFKVARNRAGTWIEKAVLDLKSQLEVRLADA